MRYLLLAVSAAILLTPAACVVRVDGTAPTARRSPPPTVPTRPPLSAVAVIYIDQWGISEPQYRYLHRDLHLSDDDIGVVLFLADRSPWNWRRIAFQRRAGHDWRTITRIVGVTPLVYFVDVPRGTHLRHPYQGLYNQYWRYHNQPQRIRLGDGDCVAMARLHLVHDRYGYDPMAYMAPGPRPSHQALLQKLEQKRRTGQLRTAPPSKPLARKDIHKQEKRRHEEVHIGHGAPAESHGPSRDKRGVARGSIARGAERPPGAKQPPGHAVSRSAGPPPGHGAKSSQVKAQPPGHSRDSHVAEHKHGGGPKVGQVASHAKRPTKGARRRKALDKGPPRGRDAVGASNAAAAHRSKPVAKGGTRAKNQPTTAAAQHTGKSAGRHANRTRPATALASEQRTPASRTDKGSNKGASSHRPTADVQRGAVTDHGRNENQGRSAGRGTDARPVAGSASPAPRKHDGATTVADQKAKDTKHAATASAAPRKPRRTETAGASGPAKGKGRTTSKERAAETHDNKDHAAAESVVATKDRTKGRTTSQARDRQSSKEVAHQPQGGATSTASVRADKPKHLNHRGVATADRSKATGERSGESPVADVRDNDGDAAVAAANPTEAQSKERTAAKGHPPQSKQEVSDEHHGADTSFADLDADDPEPARHGRAAAGDRPRGKP